MRRSPQLRRNAALLTTAVALVLTSGAAARSDGGRIMLHVATNGNGIVSITPGRLTCDGRCSFRLRRGALVTLRAVVASPFPHFLLSHWAGGCVGSAPTCVLALDRETSVRAVFVGVPQTVLLTVAGPGALRSRPSGLDCGADRHSCSATFPWGSTVELTATPGIAGRFVRWGDACSSIGDTVCRFVVAQAISRVYAAFGSAVPATEPRRLTVAFARAGTGARAFSNPSGINCPPTCESLFPAGSVVTLTVPGGARWSGGCQSEDAFSCSVIVDSDVDVLVDPHTGAAPGQYGVSVTVAGAGTVTAPGIKCGGTTGTLLDCENLFDPNATVVLSAKPGRKSRFAGWNQFCTGKKPRCTLHVASAMTVGAVFRR